MFVLGKPFQPSLMFVGKAKSLPKKGAPFRCSIWLGSGITHNHYNRLEKVVRDKYSSLLQNSVIDTKGFITLGPLRECTVACAIKNMTIVNDNHHE